ncbi:uncharacterized protein CYBJADRAFT_162852 [Cyberlindnera jadinii NRRL Y-1542]|uniref:Uncharacterized protein n=1 Tax=Cyberlindnera jadinii (strain ATCC 18201 / CBS 1600 / BCRC 20928 / JCM 3617 / NBRC 0987 / NRRL Y-1542) TaxID=983966 RepID=A0A1E4S0D6_CYBJN|nr:hypothetical protein CYBJADRAFT_162852 [Cyberlindnera jadinii NRRL Y-1542]ODV72958.1 hypothetical protein CYBJADRAFT_162852 [Cyberlindnera jadinii NRRL Y-1542]
MMFASLPTEVQVQVLSQVHSPCDVSPLFDCLAQHVNSRKLDYYTQQPLLVSVYSSSSKESHKKLFYTGSVSRDQDVTHISLGGLDHKESLLQIKNLKETSHNHESHMDMVLSEDQSSVKLFMTIQFGGEIFLETTFRLREGTKTFVKNGVSITFDLVKGSKEEKEGAYEYDESFNYALNITNVEVKDHDMVNLFEKDLDRCMFVRC